MKSALIVFPYILELSMNTVIFIFTDCNVRNLFSPWEILIISCQDRFHILVWYMSTSHLINTYVHEGFGAQSQSKCASFFIVSKWANIYYL